MANKPQVNQRSMLEIQALLHMAEDKTIPAGEFIFKEGEEDNNFYLIMMGDVEISKQTSKGKEKIITHLKAGDVLGEGVISGHTLKPNSAKAISEVQLLAFSRENFKELIATDPQAAINFLESVLNMVNSRLRASNVRLILLYEIEQLMAIYRDDLNNLSKAMIEKLIDLTNAQDGAMILKNQFEETFRTVYSTSSELNLDTLKKIELKRPSRFKTDKGNFVTVNLENMGIIVLRRDANKPEFADEEMRLIIMVADQTAKAIQSAKSRASDKAKNLLEQKKVVM